MSSRTERLCALLAALPQRNPRVGNAELRQLATSIEIASMAGQMMELPRSIRVIRATAKAEVAHDRTLVARLHAEVQAMRRTGC